MNDNVSLSILITIGVLMTEIGGVWLIKLSPRYPNSSKMKQIGKLVCIMGIVCLILGFIGIWA